MIELMLLNMLSFCKILLATIIGFLIGTERKTRDKTDGARMFALVSLSSVILAILSLQFVEIYEYDFFRLMSYGVAGIDFLGSGLIIKNNDKVGGLTGSSCLLVLVSISFLIGLEQYFLGITSAVLMYYILAIKHKKRKKKKNGKNKKIRNRSN